jgi:transglutaminase-like putative cysteine protease
MRIRIRHDTVFTYDAPVIEAYMEMRLRPLDTGGQRCESFAMTTDPAGDVLGYVDRFGNTVRHFDTIAPHERLVVSTSSEVSTPESFLERRRELSPLDRYDYLQPTVYAPSTPEVQALARGGAVPGDEAATVSALMAAVHGALEYASGSTTVKTTAAEALADGRGVCQDFAHLMIAACRALGLPARYVSGYLLDARRGSPAASHAWCDVFVAGQGWRSLDPTQGAEQSDHYVRVAVGRDYADVPPTRGVFTGAGEETMAVHVQVEEA